MKTKLKLEVEQREAEYLQELAELKTELKKTYGYRKAKIVRLAEKLEKAGTVKTDHICLRVMQDLKYEIEEDEISIRQIWKVLPSKYKLESFAKRGRQKAETTLARKLGDVVECLSGFEMENIHHKMTPHEIISASREHLKDMMFKWTDQHLYITEEVVLMASPLIRDSLEVITRAAKERRAKAKILTT